MPHRIGTVITAKEFLKKNAKQLMNVSDKLYVKYVQYVKIIFAQKKKM